MKTLYFDLGMGAAGDMLTAALFELAEDQEKTLAQLNTLGLPNTVFIPERTAKCGITGTHMRVLVQGTEEGCEHHAHHDHEHEHSHDHDHAHDHEHSHGHHHASMADIASLVSNLNVSESVKENVLAVYTKIARAESLVHGVPVTEIHFHEVGTMDALADITAVCFLLEQLSPERIVASPVQVGFGKTRCAHGLLPVPAPATAELLLGVPIRAGNIEGELCTPTGAALVRQFVSDFGPMPLLTVSRIGYGLGQKDFPAANCLRAMLGEG